MAKKKAPDWTGAATLDDDGGQAGVTSNNTMQPGDSQEILITVRDRREPSQFTIHNRVIDDWLPIIGPNGYLLYSFYVRRSNKADERSFPGYGHTSAWLGLGRSTISDHNKLLGWCGLIRIVPGNRVNSNDYYILDIPAATPERLESIRQKAIKELKPESKFLRVLLQRLDGWPAKQAKKAELLAKRKKAQTVTVVHAEDGPVPEQDTPDGLGSPVPEQGSPVAEQGSPVAEHPSPVAEQGSPTWGLEQDKATGQSNNPNEQENSNNTAGGVAEILSSFGINEPTLGQVLTLSPSETLVRDWINYIRDQDGIRNPAGFLVKQLKARNTPPQTSKCVYKNGKRYAVVSAFDNPRRDTLSDEQRGIIRGLDERNRQISQALKSKSRTSAYTVAKEEDFHDRREIAFDPYTGNLVKRDPATGEFVPIDDGDELQPVKPPFLEG